MALVTQQSKGKHPQADNRRTDYFTDVHARVWYAEVDMKTGDPVQSLKPYGWTAPTTPPYLRRLFLPPEQYRLITRAVGRGVLHDIDYEKWVSDWHARYDQWDQARIDITNKMTDGFEAVRQLENPSPAIRRIVGPGPFPPIQVIEAMAEGDPWALGLSDVVPAWFTRELHDEVVQVAKQTKLFTVQQLRLLAKIERGGGSTKATPETRATPALVPQPKRKRTKATLNTFDKDEIVEIAESHAIVTAGQTKNALILAILDAQSGVAVGV